MIKYSPFILSRNPPIVARVGLVILVIYLLGLFAAAFAMFVPVGIDFREVFYPAGEAVLALDFPFLVPGFYNPVWIAPIFASLALFPLNTAWGIYCACSLSGYALALRRFGATRLEVMLCLFSPMAVHGVLYGNIDWMILLAATFPLNGIWLTVAKPQISMVQSVLWSIRAWNKGQFWRKIAPIPLALGLSWLVGFWQIPNVEAMIWSADIFPWGIPPGIWFAFLALYRDDDRLALASGPFFAPYIAFHSWLVLLLPLLGKRHPRILFLVWVLAWVWIFLK